MVDPDGGNPIVPVLDIYTGEELCASNEIGINVTYSFPYRDRYVLNAAWAAGAIELVDITTCELKWSLRHPDDLAGFNSRNFGTSLYMDPWGTFYAGNFRGVSKYSILD